MVHDTYYAVAHFHYIPSMVLATVVVCAVWYAILRFSDPSPKRLAGIALATFVIGVVLITVPPLALFLTLNDALRSGNDPETIARWVRIVNRTATIGAALMCIAILATVATVATMARTLIRRSSDRTGR